MDITRRQAVIIETNWKFTQGREGAKSEANAARRGIKSWR